MAIVLKIKKVLYRGEPYVKLLDIDLLSERDLPKEYINGKPAVYKRGSNLLAVREPNRCTQFYAVGDELIPWERFQEIIEVCRKAGDRLREINKKIRTEYKEFLEGKEETYII